MKHLLRLTLLLIPFAFHAQNPTDCIDAVIVCGNSNVNLDVNGFGAQEIAGLGCSSQEHNSLWLRVKAQSTGTLGFNLIPQSSNITEDYDFWVFGPNVTCGNLGLPIRCSTTNPQAAGQGNNLTGLNSTSNDTSEGPGSNGDSFVQWLNVQSGEVYYIVIDRPIGNSGFTLEWVGTADLGEQPESQLSASSLVHESCDDLVPLDDSIVSIDLDGLYSPAIVGTQTNTVVTYHSTESDAILNINALPGVYQNSSAQETLFVRITNTVTECFDVTPFSIKINQRPIANDVSYTQCDEDGVYDGFTQFDLISLKDDITSGASSSTVQFHTSLSDAMLGTNPIAASTFVNSSNPQTLYAKVINTNTGCSKVSEVELTFTTTPLQDYQAPAVCDEVGSEDGINTFNLLEITNTLSSGLPGGLTISYYESLQDALNEANPLPTNYTNTIPYSQVIYARANDSSGCYGIGTVTFTINRLPHLTDDEIVYYCLNTFPSPITLSSGNLEGNLNNFQYSWSTGSPSQTIMVNEPGNYSVTVTNSSGCSSTRNITVEPSNIATINEILVLDGDLNFNNTVTVQVSGEGEYSFALYNAQGVYIDFQDSNVFENVFPGFYTVYVKDVKNDCGMVDELISVIGFPKFFTPNNDGHHDTWQVYGIAQQFQPNSKILIFDRFGKLLTELKPLGPGWDGRLNGQPLPNSDYWFSVTLQDGRVFKSHFTLKR